MAGSGTGQSNGMMVTLTIVLLLSLIGAGIGFAVGIFLQPSKDATPVNSSPPQAVIKDDKSKETQKDSEHPAESLEPDSDEATLDSELKIIPFPPVLTTLSAPQGKWIRLEGSILARPGSDKSPELLAEQAGEQILAYLRTVRLNQLQGPSGYLAVRDDLNETVRTLSNGEVQGVLIHGLLVE